MTSNGIELQETESQQNGNCQTHMTNDVFCERAAVNREDEPIRGESVEEGDLYCTFESS